MRTCTNCHKQMTEGYCIDNGCEYFCSPNCLHTHYTEEEYSIMYDNDDAYYTEWEEGGDDDDICDVLSDVF